MKKILNRILRFFTEVNYELLWKSCQEVFWLTLIAFGPIIVNIWVEAIHVNGFTAALRTRIVPGEMVSYSASFIAPTLYLIIKTHGKNYPLPFLTTISVVAFLLYTSTVALFIIAKNGWESGIHLKPEQSDLYFNLSVVFLSIAIVFRIYSVYHNGNYSNWGKNRKQQEVDFNNDFIQRLKTRSR